MVNGELADAIPLNMADLSYEEEVSKADDDFRCLRTSQLDEATITYTSGNQGNPKAIIHSHQAVVQQFASGKSALELTSEDIYWCTFDPGNMIGLTYGITAFSFFINFESFFKSLIEKLGLAASWIKTFEGFIFFK